MKLLLFPTLIFLYFPVSAQKNDNVWIMGYQAQFAPDDNFCITLFRFPNNQLEVEINDTIPTDFDVANSILCDDEGNLLLYSNEKALYNKYFRKIPGGENLFIPPLIDILGPQSILSLYLPTSEDTAIALYLNIEYIKEPVWNIGATSLFYSITSLKENQGEGKVYSIQNTIIHDTLEYGLMTAVRHANGRDWWILVPEFGTNKFYSILLNPDGPVLNGSQELGNTMPGSCLGQAVFSPDGTKYAVVGAYDAATGSFLELYDFDRCTGLLSNQHTDAWIDANFGYGVAFSPNNRFLYVTAKYSIFQYDLQAPDWIASKQTVAYYDGFESPFGSRFYIAQLAPDNKIYINCTNSETVMHVINKPNLSGTDCDVQQHAIDLGCYNAYTIPNYPNFRLGKMTGSPCDTIVSGLAGPAHGIEPAYTISPNPTSGVIDIRRENEGTNTGNGLQIMITDATGRLIFSTTLQDDIAVHHLALPIMNNGVYFVQITDTTGKIAVSKLVYSR